MYRINTLVYYIIYFRLSLIKKFHSKSSNSYKSCIVSSNFIKFFNSIFFFNVKFAMTKIK
jgi:hypothetical protein